MAGVLELTVPAPEDATEQLSAVMTLATGASITSELRTETWEGRDYLVVPVVAIVEGVLYGANAKAPELALAEEFGRFPNAWNGRPAVMNHPQMNGMFVSAAIPEVLADFGMGTLFNTRVEDNSLKTEAWLDIAKVEALGGEPLSTMQRLQGGEVVEVSVGAWLTVANRPGKFNGKDYMGVWQNVAPDHLAFLSEGTPGACSVADGCGAPRLFSVNVAEIGTATACCEACAEGAPCEQHTAAPDTFERRAEFHQLLVEELNEHVDLDFEGLGINVVPGDMAFSDIKTVVWQALLELLNVPAYDVDLLAITSNSVVYYVWGVTGLHMRNFSVDSNGTVTFSGSEVPVNLLTRIVPRMVTEPSVNTTQENDMSGNASGDGGNPTNTNTNAGTGEAPASTSLVVELQTNAVATPPTFDQLLAAADPVLRESIESGRRIFESRKKELITQLKACERNSFSDSQLEGFGLEELENMARLAQIDNYVGRAPGHTQEDVNVNSALIQGPRTVKANLNYLAPAAKN